MSLGARRWAPVAILALGGLGTAALVATRSEIEPRPQAPRVPLVRVVEAKPETVQLRVRAQGTVVPRTESELVAQVAGEVVWMSPNLVSGGFFRADEPLVRIDRVDFELDRERARAAVARARSEFDRAKTELGRQRSLQSQGVASQSRIDDAANAYRISEAALREARARLARAERDLARTELRAPFDGRVRSERVDSGQYVGRGAAVATLYAVDYAEVRIPLPDRDLRYLDIPLGVVAQGESARPAGPEVLLRAEFAGRPHEWKGRIVRTEGEIDTRSRMVTLVARVEDPYGVDTASDAPPLAVGLFVEAEILGRTLEGVFALPRAALQSAPGEEAERVFVIESQGRLRIRPVEVIRTERERVLIGKGLVAGERVSLSPLRTAVEGMSVRIAEDPPSSEATPVPRAAAREPGPS